MKGAFVLFLFSLLVLSPSYTFSQNTTKAKTTKMSSSFEGKWKGEEKCKDASAPVALLFITVEGQSAIVLSGIYSIQGNIHATIKGDTISIARQEVKDPNFMNIMIEQGRLVFSPDRRTLTGNVTIINNQVKDECALLYYK